MSKLGSIFGLEPFEPKRRLILPAADRDIEVYIIGGRAYPDDQGVIRTVLFGSWEAPYTNTELSVPQNAKAYDQRKGYARVFVFEVAFRFVPADEPGRPRTAEVVALTFDECQTFHENKLCELSIR